MAWSSCPRKRERPERELNIEGGRGTREGDGRTGGGGPGEGARSPVALMDLQDGGVERDGDGSAPVQQHNGEAGKKLLMRDCEDGRAREEKRRATTLPELGSSAAGCGRRSSCSWLLLGRREAEETGAWRAVQGRGGSRLQGAPRRGKQRVGEEASEMARSGKFVSGRRPAGSGGAGIWRRRCSGMRRSMSSGPWAASRSIRDRGEKR